MQIKETMQRYGYTPTTLAKKMGVFDSTVSRLVTGNPTVQKLQELAEQIGCHRWEFFLDEMKSDPKWVERFMDELKAAGFEVVKKDTGHTPRSANMDACPSKNPAPTGVGSLGVEEQPQDGGGRQEQEAALRPAGSIICPSCGEIIKLGVLR